MEGDHILATTKTQMETNRSFQVDSPWGHMFVQNVPQHHCQQGRPFLISTRSWQVLSKARLEATARPAFYVSLVLNFKEKGGGGVQSCFLKGVATEVPHKFSRVPASSIHFSAQVTLLGDAAHPLLPYGSQGATQAAQSVNLSWRNVSLK